MWSKTVTSAILGLTIKLFHKLRVLTALFLISKIKTYLNLISRSPLSRGWKWNMKISELAIIIKNSFESLEEGLSKRFSQIDQRFDAIDDRFDLIDGDLEDVKLRLDNKANKFELKELDNRVEKLEKHTGLKA